MTMDSLTPPPVTAVSAVPVQRTDSMAIVSLVLGITGYFGLGPLGWIPGAVLGHMARGNIRRDPTLTGDGLAVGGLVMSYIGLALCAVALVIFLLFFGFVFHQAQLVR